MSTKNISASEMRIITMANGSVNKGIVNSWSLLAFAKSHGKMQVGEFVNKETGEEFKSCIFTDPSDDTRTFVAFSSNLGVLTPKEIADQKDNLQVVELESGNYSLCKAGSNSWQDVDLF
jgi:hypothetical protein